MSRSELLAKIELLKKYERMADELKSQANTIKAEIEGYMLGANIEELFVSTYTVRYTPVVSNRFDTATFKKLHGDLYKAYVKPVSSYRFSIN